jgi:hypothetical protein
MRLIREELDMFLCVSVAFPVPADDHMSSGIHGGRTTGEAVVL